MRGRWGGEEEEGGGGEEEEGGGGREEEGGGGEVEEGVRRGVGEAEEGSLHTALPGVEAGGRGRGRSQWQHAVADTARCAEVSAPRGTFGSCNLEFHVMLQRATTSLLYTASEL